MSISAGHDLTQILQFQAEVARSIDDDRLEAWPAFFEERCLYSITTADNYRRGLKAGIIYADSRAMLIDRVASLRHANIYERQAYRHMLGLSFVAGGEHGVVRTETPFMVARIMRTGETALFATGRYLDVLRMGSGTIAILQRIAVCDSCSVDTLLALPL